MLISYKAKHPKKKNLFLSVLLLCFTITSDQYTKYLAIKILETGGEMFLFNNLLHFTLIENHGGFLGIVSHLPEGIRFFLLTTCVSLLLFVSLLHLLNYKSKRDNFRFDLPLAIVLGGGVSNLLDRLLNNGGVTDFIRIGTGNFHTGIFNLADVYILSGSFFLGYIFFSSPTNHP